MLAVPPAILDMLKFQPGAKVGMVVDGGRLVIEPRARPHYTLAELLAASDYSQAQPADEREWMGAPRAGGEII